MDGAIKYPTVLLIASLCAEILGITAEIIKLNKKKYTGHSVRQFV